MFILQKIMNKSSLGKTGIEVSEIAFGGVEIGAPYGVHKELMPQDAAVSLLKAAVDVGINLFDTARMYGLSEERIGRAFEGMREKVIISTKCSHLHNNDGKIPCGNMLRDFIETSITTSLKMLKTDHFDIFLSHSSDAEILANQEVADVFASLKKRGLTRAVGVSTYGAKDTQTAIESGNWDVVQLSFNLLDQSCGQLFPVAQQRGVGIMVRSVLMRGILSDAKFVYHEKVKCVEVHRQKYFNLLSPKIPNISDLATKFVLSFAEVSSVLVGIDKIEFLNKAVALADGVYLDDAMLAKIKQLAYPDPEFLNIAIWDRKGWTK